MSRPSGRSGSYTGLIGFNPRRLQGPKRGMSSHATDLSVCAKSSSSSSSMCSTPAPLRVNVRNFVSPVGLKNWPYTRYWEISTISVLVWTKYYSVAYRRIIQRYTDRWAEISYKTGFLSCVSMLYRMSPACSPRSWYARPYIEFFFF